MGLPRYCGLKFSPAAWVSCLAFINCLLWAPLAWPSRLSVTSDERVQVATQPDRDTKNQQLLPSLPLLNPEPDTLHQVEDEKSRQLQHYKEQVSDGINSSLEEEPQLMDEMVQTLDRESAYRWLVGFISSKPWNCSIKQQSDWIEAIMYAAERNQLPLCKEILALVASIISIESSFLADPLAVDPSRHGSIESLLQRAEEKLYQKFGTLMSLPPLPRLYSQYKERYYPKLQGCRTEGEIEVVARSIAENLRKDAENLPTVIRNVIYKEIDKVSNVVRTKGSMQLNFVRASQVMKDRGEQFTDQELTEYMYTVNGGVDVGVAALKPMFVQYAERYAQKGDLSWLFLVGMDYHYGPFSSRNMMEQIRIRDLSGQKIAIDGDFLHYNENGKPEERDSETLLAAIQALPTIPKNLVFKAFLLEKDPHYIYTDVHRLIVGAHRERFGETPFAVIGELGLGENAEVKHGITWTTNVYLRKLDRYLNSIPWDN